MARQTAEIMDKTTSKSMPEEPKEPSRRGPGRPPAREQAEASHNFFESCNRIDPEDWGTRCWVYLYRKEPIIDRSGDWHYVDKYDENPKSEDRILADHGSGKYRLMLNFTKPGAVRSATVDTVVTTLINVKFPPKVPPGEWVDDSRNRRWAWAKDSFPKEPQNGAGVLETLKVFNDIRKGVQDEQKPEPPPSVPNPVSQVRETIQALKELAPQPAAPATENQTLQSIVQLIMSQTKAQADQNTTLLTALLNQRSQPAPAPNTSFTDAISVISDKLIPLVEKLKPSAEEAINTFTKRSKMTGWMEMIQPAIPQVVDFFKPLGYALAQRLMTPLQGSANGQFPAAPGPQGPGALPGALPQPGAPSSPQVPGAIQGLPPVLNMIAVPMLTYMRLDSDPRELGRDFASWVHEGYSADPRFSQALALARASGANTVLIAFKGSPYWLDKGLNHDQPSLADMEPKFQVFIESFLRWQPSQEPEEDEDVIDITGGQIG
jgi:hypothetical protein